MIIEQTLWVEVMVILRIRRGWKNLTLAQIKCDLEDQMMDQLKSLIC
jgi:hypothetical protein